MPQADLPPSTAGPDRAGPAPLPVLHRALVLAALSVLVFFITSRCVALWREWKSLKDELATLRNTDVVGYPGITPQYSFARVPADWFHDEGDFTLLWGGWRAGQGHQWFRVPRGEVDPARITGLIGKDVIRAIDYPVVECGGGMYWSRIPDDAAVCGFRVGGVETAYPLTVLEKVLVVNDTVDERPCLVLTSPYSPNEERTQVFDPVVEGRRLNMGMSGYFHDNRPVLFDRGTESLWVGSADGLVAIAGKHKGQRLPRVARLQPVSWSRWRSDHPACRLVVGADRTRQEPPL